MRQLLLNLAFLFAVTILVAVPVVGFAAVWLLFPALVVGPHAIARAPRQTARRRIRTLLVAGIPPEPAGAVAAGRVFLAAMLVVLAATRWPTTAASRRR